MEWVPLITAFGIGSIVSTVVQTVLAQRAQKKQRSFEERKAAYIGLWEAIRRQARKFDKGSEIDLGLWIVRCELVSPNSVRQALKIWGELEPGSEARPEATERLKQSMCRDLGVSR